MSEKKKKISFTVACINEFAQHNNLSVQEAFRYLFQFKGIAFIKENYEVEHTLDFGTIVEDFAKILRHTNTTPCIPCKKVYAGVFS